MQKKIMIVEDHEEMQFVYRTLFRRMMPEAVIVAQEESAEGALEKIPSLNPDLMIIDITLPGMSGIDLTRIVRQRHKAGIKLLIVTAHEPDRYRDAAEEAGADDLLTKNNILAVINKVKLLLT